MTHPRENEFQELLLTVNHAIQGLNYLAALDAALIPHPEATPYGYPLVVVDTAHARWAAGTAITALDLCAAILGRLYGGGSYPHPDTGRELDIVDARASSLVTQHPVARRWLDEVWADADYQWLKALRTAFVHREAAPSLIVVVITVGDQRPVAQVTRPRFEIEYARGKRYAHAPEVIQLAGEVAKRHFGPFRDELEGGGI